MTNTNKQLPPVDVAENNTISFDGVTIGDLIDMCRKCKTREEASRLLDAYRRYCDTPETADANLGYIFGYCSPDEIKRLYALFPVCHPVFGCWFGRSSTSEREVKHDP